MTKILAHRGANKHAPQNTIPAFLKAIELYQSRDYWGCKGSACTWIYQAHVRWVRYGHLGRWRKSVKGTETASVYCQSDAETSTDLDTGWGDIVKMCLRDRFRPSYQIGLPLFERADKLDQSLSVKKNLKSLWSVSYTHLQKSLLWFSCFIFLQSFYYNTNKCSGQ